MGKLCKNILNSFITGWTRRDGVRFRDIRLPMLVYCLAYTFELILFTVRSNFLPMEYSVAGVRGWTIAHTLHMIASLVFMLLWSEKFKHLIRTSVVIMIVGFIPYVFLPIGFLRFLFGVIFYIGLGGAVTSARCGFAFASNNAERLFGMLITFVVTSVFRLINSLGADGIVVTVIVPLLLLLLLCYCLLRFKEQDFIVKNEATKSDTRGLYWALAYFIIYFAVDGYGGSLISSSDSGLYVYRFIGMMVAVVVIIMFMVRFKMSTWHLWNMFFLFSIGLGVFAVLAPSIGTEAPMYLCSGLSVMGWPLCIYMLGCAQRNFASYALLKKCTVIFVVLSPVSVLSSDLVNVFAPHLLPIVSLIFILTVSIVFFMLSPMSYRDLFQAMWMDDIYNTDMQVKEKKAEEIDRFRDYELTRRQKEVAVLLLGGNTRREIAGELGISESTVKLHISELYKKLRIRNRIDLFREFGADGMKKDSIREDEIEK